MKRRKLANGIMVLLILVIGAAGVLTAGFIRGWFDRDTEAATLTELRGVVTMKRDGVAYPVEPNTILRRGDVLVTSPRATACIQIGGSFLALNEKSELRVEAPAQTEAALTLVMGEAFCQAAAEHPIALTLGEGQPLALREATAFASVRSGARSLSMYAGEVVWGETEAGTGQMLSWTVDALSVEETSLQALNDFAITWMRRAGETMELCYTSQDLDRLEADRAAAMQAQLQQALNPTVPETDPTAPTQSAGLEQTQPVTEPSIAAQEPTTPPSTEPNVTDPPATDPPITEPDPTEPPPETDPPRTCSIAIYCDTILNNWDSLEPEKAGYVPSDGVLLYPLTVEFEDGETVFDILNRVCASAGIQLEYSWTPMYNSYYVEGIGNLYEFDCGDNSGWMYRVNGWFPNYGCSSYTLSDGDVIVWCYTCNGLGADVGGGMG